MKLNKKTSLYIFVIGLLFISFLTISNGYDYFWHIKVGEEIIKNGFFYTDIFSWYGIINNLTFISHEWLSDVVIYIYKIIFGSSSVIAFVSVNMIILYTFFYLVLKEKYSKNILVFILFMFIGTLTMSFSYLPRPHIISFLLLAILIYILEQYRYKEDSKLIYCLPVLAILWSNFHGGSSNLIYLIPMIVTGLNIFSKDYSYKKIKRLVIISLVSFLAISINPHGFKMLIYPYINIADTFMQSIISEWQPINLRISSNIYIFVFLLFVAFISLVSKKKNIINKGIIFIFICLTIKSVRFAPLLFIISNFYLFDLIDNIELGNIVYYVLGLIGVLLFCTFLMNYKIIVNKVNNFIIDKSIVNYLKESNPKRLYNYYDYGGYLIYNDILVFVDGRADMYSKHNLRDFYDIYFKNNDYANLIDKYDFDYFIIEKKSLLNGFFIGNNDYSLEIEKDGVVVYKKIIQY